MTVEQLLRTAEWGIFWGGAAFVVGWKGLVVLAVLAAVPQSSGCHIPSLPLFLSAASEPQFPDQYPLHDAPPPDVHGGVISLGNLILSTLHLSEIS